MDRLLFSGKKLKLERETQIKEAEQTLIQQARPFISEASRCLKTYNEDQEVVQRLFQYQKLYNAKKEEQQKKLVNVKNIA